MTDRGVSDNDMSNRSWPPHTDASWIPDAALSDLLAGGTPPADGPASLHQVADLLSSLRAAPGADEGAGQAAAIAEFRARVRVSPHAAQSHRRRPATRTPLALIRTRAGNAATAAVVGLGGIAAAAYAGALPAAAQQAAHDTIGAPTPKPHPSPAASHRATPVGPNASGHPAFGLCTAFLHGKEHGRQADKSVAFRNLARAAGGAANVTSYCAKVPHPGAAQSAARHRGDGPQPRERMDPTGKPPHP